MLFHSKINSGLNMDPSTYGNYDPATIPLAPPPPGVTPNFTNPYNRTWEIHVTSAVCLTMTTLFVALRFYAKVFLIKQTTRDDCNVAHNSCIREKALLTS